MEDFQESNKFLKLFPSAFKTKQEPAAGLIPILSCFFFKLEQKRKSDEFSL